MVTGEVFDVAVDLREASSSFGQWVGETLSAANKHQLWVPPGFAHGFLVLSDTVGFEYKYTDFYAPEFERTIRWDDPDIGIEWPLATGAVIRIQRKTPPKRGLECTSPVRIFVQRSRVAEPYVVDSAILLRLVGKQLSKLDRDAVKTLYFRASSFCV